MQAQAHPALASSEPSICELLRVAFLLNTAPMKCLKGPVPRVVATSSGEAAADQEMAHLLLAQELSGISGDQTN